MNGLVHKAAGEYANRCMKVVVFPMGTMICVTPCFDGAMCFYNRKSMCRAMCKEFRRSAASCVVSPLGCACVCWQRPEVDEQVRDTF